MVLLALFGAVMGQGVVWYTGQFYAQNFLETRCYLILPESGDYAGSYCTGHTILHCIWLAQR